MDIQYLAHLHYSYEALFTPDLIEQAWGDMFHVSQWHVGEGVRRILLVGKKGVTRLAFKEMALIPGKGKRPEWPYHNTFNVTDDSGFWHASF